ncbi:E3 ubiquitin-protein ligase TRIM56-like [Gigantopelta aegis]|uniref:E3 ubiquitin-protein ligase TRIM56-like n=1 Tax=Gigantopelta aegis TaxID=1735272 RepID=UPI001B8893FF|nr:E3 ubiquitin-protein ligase TRIM56-like [Gigantopelta aegis]
MKAILISSHYESRCSDGHNASSTTWNHKKVLLKDIRKGSYDKELRNLLRLTCSQHKDKEIEYFCDTCHTPICLACVFLEHREHICLTASEAVVAQKDRLVNYAAKVNEKLQHLENEKKVVCENFARVNKHQTEANANIEKQIEGIIAQIERHRQQALQLVEDRIEETLKQCNSQVEQAYLKITLAKGCLEFCETMIVHGKDEEVLYLEETITKRLQQLEELPNVDLKPIARDVFPDINEQTCGIQDLESLPSAQVDSVQTESNFILHSCLETSKISFKLLRIFDTGFDSDTQSPVIRSMAVGNNTIILSDSANGKIKCISTSGTLKECLTTGDDFSPFAVAVCKNVIGAVHANYLYMFDQIGKGTHKLMLSAKPPGGTIFTFALANYRNEGFIVGNLPDNYFRVYSTDGILQERFSLHLQKPLTNLSVDKSGHLVTCEWGDSCVRVRDLHGTKLTNCQVPPTWKPFAAHEDRNGFIYVVNNSQHAVSVFDPDGTDILHHATIPDGLQKPLNLAFDDEGLMYLVNIFGYINVYKVSVERLTVNAPRELGSTAWCQ